ncbi:MAG: RNA-binding protein 7 [Paramarteilia canceri]
MSAAENSELYVGNISDNCPREILIELFHQVGPMKNILYPVDKNGRNKGYAKIGFYHSESVPYAIKVLSGTQLYGRTLRLDYPRDNHNKHSPQYKKTMNKNFSHSDNKPFFSPRNQYF